jgi:ribose transport system permease protein
MPPKVNLHGWGTPLTLLAAWLLLIAATGLYRPDFLSHQTLLAITFTMAIVGVLAIGQTLVAISGGFLDLSQPSALILSSLVAVRLAEAGMPLPVLVVAAVLAGMAWGFLNATIIVFGKLNPVIVTLATNFIGLAALFLVFQLAQVPQGSDIHALGRTAQFGLPAIWWPMALLVLVVGYLLPRTRYGRRAIAVGGNRYAAKARGISLRATRFAVFIAAGGFAGFAAILFAASSGPFNPGSGNSLQLNVIASVILAGISLSGGRGNLWLLLLSVGFLSTIPTSLVFFGLSSDTQSIFQGLILVIAVAIDGFRARRSTP